MRDDLRQDCEDEIKGLSTVLRSDLERSTETIWPGMTLRIFLNNVSGEGEYLKCNNSERLSKSTVSCTICWMGLISDAKTSSLGFCQQ